MKKNSLAIINFTFAALMLTGCNVGTPQLGKSLLEDVVAAMTVEEKADLLVGSLSRARTDTAVIVGIKEVIPGAAGTSNAVERLGIPNIVFADGP
ncbi:MAG: beta-glucosidase, partial [Tannerellaceae bacterium]|nr:beta-glucosidase [Tannerellaceae bacterium]